MVGAEPLGPRSKLELRDGGGITSDELARSIYDLRARREFYTAAFVSLAAIVRTTCYLHQTHLEFSYLGTTNHYLTDVVGLLWLGLTLPELVLATTWREWAAKELFNARGGDLVWSACDCNQHWRIKRHADVRVWR